MKKIKDNLDWNDYDKIENLGIQFMTIGMKSKSVDFTSPLEETQYRNTLNMPQIPNDWIYKRQIKNMYQKSKLNNLTWWFILTRNPTLRSKALKSSRLRSLTENIT